MWSIPINGFTASAAAFRAVCVFRLPSRAFLLSEHLPVDDSGERIIQTGAPLGGRLRVAADAVGLQPQVARCGLNNRH